MSIVESREELEAAKARLASTTTEQLTTDIGFWSVASLDASAEFNELTERRQGAQVRYLEAQEWMTLIAKELRSRRDARTGTTPPTES